MSYIECKYALEDFPEKSADESAYGSGFGIDLYFRNKFIQDKENQKSKGQREEVLKKKIIDQ
jgi:hypothetical protein